MRSQHSPDVGLISFKTASELSALNGAQYQHQMNGTSGLAKT